MAILSSSIDTNAADFRANAERMAALVAELQARRAEAEIARADLILWLVAPDVDPLDPPVQEPLWTVGTKADLATVRAQYVLSVKTGTGVSDLLAVLAAFAETAAGAGAPALVSREPVAIVPPRLRNCRSQAA